MAEHADLAEVHQRWFENVPAGFTVTPLEVRRTPQEPPPPGDETCPQAETVS